MLNNTYRYDANHPMCTGTMNTVFHRILNAFTLSADAFVQTFIEGVT